MFQLEGFGDRFQGHGEEREGILESEPVGRHADDLGAVLDQLPAGILSLFRHPSENEVGVVAAGVVGENCGSLVRPIEKPLAGGVHALELVAVLPALLAVLLSPFPNWTRRLCRCRRPCGRWRS